MLYLVTVESPASRPVQATGRWKVVAADRVEAVRHVWLLLSRDLWPPGSVWTVESLDEAEPPAAANASRDALAEAIGAIR